MDIIKICVNVLRNSVLYFLSGHLVRSSVRHAINFHFLFFTSIRNSFQNFSQFQTLPITKNVVLESDSREIFSYKYIYIHIHRYTRNTFHSIHHQSTTYRLERCSITIKQRYPTTGQKSTDSSIPARKYKALETNKTVSHRLKTGTK